MKKLVGILLLLLIAVGVARPQTFGIQAGSNGPSCVTDSIITVLSKFDQCRDALNASGDSAKARNANHMRFLYISPTGLVGTPKTDWEDFVEGEGYARSYADSIYLRFSEETTLRHFACRTAYCGTAQCGSQPQCSSASACTLVTYAANAAIPNYKLVSCNTAPNPDQLTLTAQRYTPVFTDTTLFRLFRTWILDQARPSGVDGLFFDNAPWEIIQLGDIATVSGGNLRGTSRNYDPTDTESVDNSTVPKIYCWLRHNGGWNKFFKEVTDSLNSWNPKKYVVRNCGVGGGGSQYLHHYTGTPLRADSVFSVPYCNYGYMEFNGGIDRRVGEINWPYVLYYRNSRGPGAVITAASRPVEAIPYQEATMGSIGLGLIATVTKSAVANGRNPVVGCQLVFPTDTTYVGCQANDARGQSLNPCAPKYDVCYSGFGRTYIPAMDSVRTYSKAYVGEPLGVPVMHDSGSVVVNNKTQHYQIWRRPFGNKEYNYQWAWAFVRVKDSGSAVSVDSAATKVTLNPPDVNGQNLFKRVLHNGNLTGSGYNTMYMPTARAFILVAKDVPQCKPGENCDELLEP